MSDPEVKHILNMFEPTTLDRKKKQKKELWSTLKNQVPTKTVPKKKFFFYFTGFNHLTKSYYKLERGCIENSVPFYSKASF